MTQSTTPIPAALHALWTRFLPEIQARVNILRDAVAQVATNSLTPDARESAAQAAHKLAGTLGTFGLMQGTEIARSLELALGDTATLLEYQNLSSQANLLAVLVDNHLRKSP